METLRLKPGKEKKIRNQYLWIFRDDIATHPKDRQHIPDGSVVEVQDAEKCFLGVGFYNSRSHIVCRILSLQNVPVDRNFFYHRLKKVLHYREQWSLNSDARRLVHAEGDLVPGFIADQYGDYLVVQFRTLGMEQRREDILAILQELIRPKGIVDRSDMESRIDEGLEPASGLVSGVYESPVIIREHGRQYIADLLGGHKTGFYLDQRDNRWLAASLVRSSFRCLDLFCYTGGFAIALAQTGAAVWGIDQDAQAITTARENARLNNIESRAHFIHGDVYDFLDHPQQWIPEACSASMDMIILDPPAIAKRKEGVEKLKWAFWKLMHGALPLLRSGGFLVVSSCAYHLSVDLLLEAARFASADQRCRLRVHTITYQPADHPWILQMPETLYLKTVYFQKS